MARKFQDMAAKAGKYTDRDGKEKHRFQHVGKLVTEDDGRQWGTLEFLGMEIAFSVFDQKARDGAGNGGSDRGQSHQSSSSSQPARAQQPASSPGLDDDIPF